MIRTMMLLESIGQREPGSIHTTLIKNSPFGFSVKEKLKSANFLPKRAKYRNILCMYLWYFYA